MIPEQFVEAYVKRFLGFRTGLLAIATICCVVLLSGATTGMAQHLGTPTFAFVYDLLTAGVLAGTLLLLDATSWSLMTSRR